MRSLYITFLLILAIQSTFAAVDPAPPHFTIILETSILKNGAYFTVTELSAKNNAHTTVITQYIDSSKFYSFDDFCDKKDLRVVFKDSTSMNTILDPGIARYPKFEVSIDQNNKLRAKEIASHEKRTKKFQNTALIFILLLFIRFIPPILLILPADFGMFLKKYGKNQLIYLLVFFVLGYFLNSIGLLITLIIFILTPAIDQSLLNELYKKKVKPWRITSAVIISAILTLILVVISIFASVFIELG